MDRRTKASLNRDKAIRLQAQWGIDALQVRYSDDGHWYATLTRFPAALLDARGYLRFATEQDYRRAPISIGKQISVRKPGISAVPGYVQVSASEPPVVLDVDIHSIAVNEGQRRLVRHLQRERKRTIVRMKKARAASLDCEVCGFHSGAHTEPARQSIAKFITWCRCRRQTMKPRPVCREPRRRSARHLPPRHPSAQSALRDGRRPENAREMGSANGV